MRLRASDLEKRYQVFISSTFQDLQGARQEVSQALLRADCFPAGMELFPAADEEQFEFIKTVIDQSDYYILISAGRYGSIHPETGLSYTEMEYDYAVETGKPVIRLLHKDPFRKLSGEEIEETDEGKKKLRAFQSKLRAASLVNFWEEANELGQLVVFGLMDAQKRKPAVGWLRADTISDKSENEIFKLRAKVTALQRKASSPTVPTLLEINLPLVDACLEKFQLIEENLGIQAIWLSLENGFLQHESRGESELAEYLTIDFSIDNDVAHLIVDALVLESVLQVSGTWVKLTKKGNEFVRKMRLQSLLS